MKMTRILLWPCASLSGKGSLNAHPKDCLVAGSNDIATATAIRLYRAGFSGYPFTTPHPLDIHHKRTLTVRYFPALNPFYSTAVTFAGSIGTGRYFGRLERRK